jgi:hypothetical protein
MNAQDMRSLMMIVEGRQNDNPDVSYELSGTTKKNTLAKIFTKIAASVTGRLSEKYTKLALKFQEIEVLTTQLGQLRDVANEEAKDAIETLFDAEDAMYTRYIDTVSLAITMSKDQEATSTETSNLNVNDFLEDLMTLVGEDLQPAVSKLLEQHTKVTTKLRAAQRGRVTVNLPTPVQEGELTEGDMTDKITNYAAKFANKVMSYLGRYDSKLNAIAAKYNLA